MCTYILSLQSSAQRVEPAALCYGIRPPSYMLQSNADLLNMDTLHLINSLFRDAASTLQYLRIEQLNNDVPSKAKSSSVLVIFDLAAVLHFRFFLSMLSKSYFSTPQVATRFFLRLWLRRYESYCMGSWPLGVCMPMRLLLGSLLQGEAIKVNTMIVKSYLKTQKHMHERVLKLTDKTRAIFGIKRSDPSMSLMTAHSLVRCVRALKVYAQLQ